MGAMKAFLLFIAMTAGIVPAAIAQAQDVSPAAAGKKLFVRCVACHSMSAAARPMTGPHLEGIVDRKAASLPGFTYSETLRAQNFNWDEARLDAFLEAPRTTHPGMCLTFTGLPKAEDRAALIAYLKGPAS